MATICCHLFFYTHFILLLIKTAKQITSGNEDLILDLIGIGPEVLGHKDIEQNTPKDRGGSEWKEAYISLD